MDKLRKILYKMGATIIKNYFTVQIHVPDREHPLICLTYQYSDKSHPPSDPSPHYKHTIICGALEHNLPFEYIKCLQEIPTNGYKGRINLELKAISHLNESGSSDDEN